MSQDSVVLSLITYLAPNICMPNHSKTRIDFWRTQTWARFCANSLEVKDGADVARRLRVGQENLRSANTLWTAYLSGLRTPYNDWAPVPDSKWARRAATPCPGSWAWYATPFWYLIEEEEYSPSQIITCAEGLPKRFREDLLYEAAPGTSPALRLRDVHFHWIYLFCDPGSPWGLGATACAMRRAELAGDAACMRWAAVGLIWQLSRLIEPLDRWVAEPLIEVRTALLERFEKLTYLDGLRLPIVTSQDEVRFGAQYEKFITWKNEDPTLPGSTSWPPSDL